ncbi:hypothetical protein BGZ61DRAFT_544256 [Ilyonectria robusta]|uniref:uncharacterized protein n=1 Tax=Ilyonectria robusta TaxID=1079257 RepID=UPI001E8E0357|nr:uncharacterized protein BGZ61DRAFT_544256 [Ilyonectria robusta]KAH8738008.1 hypothetical protein BGZ61DRAFT_544256 [Ilyonectria robusta]
MPAQPLLRPRVCRGQRVWRPCCGATLASWPVWFGLRCPCAHKCAVDQPNIETHRRGQGWRFRGHVGSEPGRLLVIPSLPPLRLLLVLACRPVQVQSLGGFSPSSSTVEARSPCLSPPSCHPPERFTSIRSASDIICPATGGWFTTTPPVRHPCPLPLLFLLPHHRLPGHFVHPVSFLIFLLRGLPTQARTLARSKTSTTTHRSCLAHHSSPRRT